MDAQAFAYDVCRSYVADLPSTHPLKDKILGFVRSRNLKALCSVSQLVDMQCIDIDTFRSLLQVEAFFKKNEAFSDRDRCLEAAKVSFAKAELLCKLTNKRLNYFYLHQNRLDSDMQLIVNRARGWISTVLGDIGKFIDVIPQSIRLTSGATASAARSNSLPFMKVKRNLLATPGSIPYIEALFKFCNLREPRVCPTSLNRVEFVPKNWKTYRTIACEPEGVMPFQLAFDSYAKRRLRKFGIDLSSQFENQRMAEVGSVDGGFSTIDISNASDTVSLNCVAWLFPTEWYSFMKAFRSSHYRSPTTGRISQYEKFSSMGNGMTFSCETLIFAALVRAVGSKAGRVYGDDICIEPAYYDRLTKALTFFGFKVNHEKSFNEGPYRESCGTHWFNGTLITPFFVRGNLKTKPFQAHNVNGLIKVSTPLGKTWRFLREFCETQRLLLVPFSDVSTSGVFIDFRSSLASRRTRVRHYLYFSRVYEFRSGQVLDSGIRSLLLWYHDSFRIVLPDSSERARVRSRYAVPLGRYRQRRVVVRLHDESVADHLPIWSEYILRVI